MISELFKQVASKGDWAAVLPAAVLAFVLDALFDLVAAPAFTAPVCALVGGAVALAVKRNVEVYRRWHEDRRLLALRHDEAERVRGELVGRNLVNAASALDFECRAARIRPDIEALTKAIEIARSRL